jgi:hypothetical protein
MIPVLKSVKKQGIHNLTLFWKGEMNIFVVKGHKRKFFFIIVCIGKYLVKYNLAFCGANNKIYYDDSNENFLA